MSPLPLMSAPSSDPFKAIRMSAIDPHDTLTMPLSPMPEPIMDTSAFGAPAPSVSSPRQQEEGELTQKHQTRMAEQSAKPEGFGHKLLHGLNVFRNIAETSLVPGVAMADPTSELHKNLVDENRTDRLADLQKQDLDERKEFSQEGVHQAQLALNTEKANEATKHHTRQDVISAYNKGYDLGDDGNLTPLTYDQMSPQAQAAVDLKGSQDRLAQAKTEFEQAKNANLPEQMEIARQKIAAEVRGQDAALQRLGLQREKLGLAEDKFYNPQPTSYQQKTGDLAQSGIQQLKAMREVVNRRKDQFGPAAGTTTQFQNWIGSEDPDAATYRAAQNFLAEHGAGVFGSRNVHVINDIKNLANQRQNPAALDSTFDRAEQTFKHFVEAGTVHGKGQEGHAAQQGRDARSQTFTVNGVKYSIPADKIEEFKKDHPDAR